MSMNDIELMGVPAEGLLLHDHQGRVAIERPAQQPKRFRTGRPELGRSLRIPARIQGDVMALAYQFFSDIRNDSLRTSIQLGRYAFPQRGDLCNLHVDYPFLLQVTTRRSLTQELTLSR